MRYKVLRNRMLVEPTKITEVKEKTASGLFLPVQITETVKPNNGTVVDVNAIQGINIGDVVVYKPFTGTEVKIDGKDYYIFREDDILLIEQ